MTLFFLFLLTASSPVFEQVIPELIGHDAPILRPLVTEAHDGIASSSLIGGNIFATQNLILDKTGIKVSTSRLLADHLVHDPAALVDRILPKNIKSSIESQLKFIGDRREGIRNGVELATIPDARIHEGDIHDHLAVLKKAGGIFVDDNSDWIQDIEPSLEALRQEQEFQKLYELARPGDRKRIFDAGLKDIVSISVMPEQTLPGVSFFRDMRKLVKDNVKDLKIETLYSVRNEYLTHAGIYHRKQSIIQSLKSNAVYAKVDGPRYLSLIGKGEPYLPLAQQYENFKFPRTSENMHSIVIGGYVPEDDTFVVLDSLMSGPVRISSSDLVGTISKTMILKD